VKQGTEKGSINEPTVEPIMINVAQSGQRGAETCLSGNRQWTTDHLRLEVKLQLIEQH